MLMKSALMALAGMAVFAEAGVVPVAPQIGHRLVSRQNRGGNNNNNNNNNNQKCLNNNVVQSASTSTGQSGATAADGQVNSKTDTSNFINFCSGKTITNGEQNRGGSCNGIVMGEIPAVGSMVSSVITNPKHNDNIAAGQTFTVQVNIANMELGSFTNATSTYYSAPQALQNGKIVGHTHVTIQDIGNSLNPTTPLDAQKFAFFKGINDAGNGNGQLSTTVDGGLPAGNYRICSMAGSSNHQPVLMPVAQRGAQDDCKYFTVSNNAGGNNNNNNNANNNNANNNNNNKNTGNNNKANNANGASTAGRNAAAAGSLGGAAPAVEDSGDATRPFKVNQETFVGRDAAVQRACAIQNNACSDAVNRDGASFTLQQCNDQETACRTSL